MSPQERESKDKIKKWDYIRLKSFHKAKETIIKMKRQPTNGKKIFANHTSHKALLSKIYKELIQLSSKKMNNPIKKGKEDMNRHFSKNQSFYNRK